MPIRLVLTDLDGTAVVIAEPASPSDRVVRAVASARTAGIGVAAVTARPWPGARRILREMGLTGLCVLSGGTRVVDAGTGTVLWRRDLTPVAVAAILAACGPFAHELLVGEEQPGGGAPAAQRSMAAVMALSPGAAFLMAATPAAGAAALAVVAACPEVSAVAVASWTGRAVDVHFTPAHGSKFYGATAARKLLGVRWAETVAMGDADSDIPLLAAAGLRIAVVGASPALTASAHLIAPSAADDGLAVVLEALALDPTRAALRARLPRAHRP